MLVGPAGRPQPSRPAAATAVQLVDLPAEVLDRVLRFALAPPSPSPATTLLLICRTLRAKAAPLVYARADLSRLDAPASLEFALCLDPLFSLRLDDYTLPTTSRNRNLPSNPPRAFYPIDPDNAHDLSSSSAGARFRLHLRHLEIYSRWDATGPLVHSWHAASKGVPFAAVPILLDVVRRAAPNLRSLRLDLPKSTQVGWTQQAEILRLADAIVECVGKFGMLDVLAVDAWVLADVALSTILDRCTSLLALTIRRAILTQTVFRAAGRGPLFGLVLRRLTLTDTVLTFTFITSVIKTFLNLESLQLMGYTDGPEEPLSTFVGRADPLSRPRFVGVATFAPNLQSLVLRPSYVTSTNPTDDRLVRLVALLLAVSPSLRRLHLGVHFAETTYLVPLLSAAFERLERLWIGFISAQEEVGDGVRLTRADDARGRPGVLRGVDVEGDRDPLKAGTTDTDVRENQVLASGQLSSSTSQTMSGTAVLRRIPLEQVLVRSLVDPRLQQPWPPSSISAYRRFAKLIRPFPRLTHLLGQAPRSSTLQEFFIFEDEYAGAFARLRDHVAATGGGRWIGPGVRGLDPGDEAWRLLMEGSSGR